MISLSLKLQDATSLPSASRWGRLGPDAGEALSHEEEREILLACQAGDSSGFHLLVQRYRRLVWAAVDAQGLDENTAEDIVQGAFIRAFEKLGSFAFRSSFSSWLYRVARNHALGIRRSAGRRPFVFSLEHISEAAPGGTAAEVQEHAGAFMSAADADPQEAYATRQRSAALAGMLAELPAEQREALNLFYAAELSYEQIADTLALPLNTVRTRLHRAKLRLQALAESRGWNDD